MVTNATTAVSTITGTVSELPTTSTTSTTQLTGSRSVATDAAAIPAAIPGTTPSPGSGEQDTDRAAQEQRGEGRTAAKAAQAEHVRDALEQQDRHQSADRPCVGIGGELRQGGLAGQGHLGRRTAGDDGVERRAPGRTECAEHRVPQRMAASCTSNQGERKAPDW